MLTPTKDSISLVLAVDIAARTYIDDMGPGKIFLNSYLYFRDRGKTGNRPARIVSEMLECIKCLSVWTAVLLLIVRAISRPLFLAITVPLAVSRVITWIGTLSEAVDDGRSYLTRH